MNQNAQVSERRRGINPNVAHFNAGTAKNSSGASFAQKFRVWMNTQDQFSTQKEFAAHLQVAIETVQQWLTARAFPSDPLCDLLFTITALECFSSSGRVAARTEHEQKRGLSHAAIAKRANRQHVSADELAECRRDPEKAFTIRRDDWIVCLECGQLLKSIRATGAGAHLKEHQMSDMEYRTGPDHLRPRYGKNRALVSNATSQLKRAEVAARENFRPPDGRSHLRRQQKGWTVPPEFRRKQSARMRGKRKPEWSKSVADVEFVWNWLIEGRTIEETSRTISAASDGAKFTPGGVWTRLKATLALPIRREVVTDESAIDAAMQILLPCAGDDKKLREAISRLCEQSRREIASGEHPRVARETMMGIATVREWLHKNRSRSELPSNLARMFLAEAPRRKYAGVRRTSSKNRDAGRPEQKRELFRTAKTLHDGEDLSWPKIAKRLTPAAYAKDPRKAGEAIRRGVERLP